MKKRATINFKWAAAVLTAAMVLSLTTCGDFALKQTIDELVFGWSRQVTLTAPENEELRAEKTPLLEWEAAGGAAAYDLQINPTNDFDGVESIRVTAPEYEFPEPLTMGDERFWRVRARSSDGTAGEWSEAWSFIVAPSSTAEFIATLNIGGSPYKLIYDKGYCYVPAGGPGLKLIDVSDPAQPADVSPAMGAEVTDNHTPLVIKDKYLYLVDTASSPEELYIFDITDPENPVQAGPETQLIFNIDSVDENFFCASAEAIAVSGPNLYALGRIEDSGDGVPGVLRIDVNNPASPSINDFEPLSSDNEGFDLETYGNYGYATVETVGMDIFSFVPELQSISTFSIPTMKSGFIHFKDNYAFVTDQAGPLRIVDIIDPASPEAAGTYDPGEATAGGIVYGCFSFVAGLSSNKMHILDIRNVAEPQLVYSIENALINYISGNYAYGVDYYTGKFYVTDLIPEE